MRYEVVEIKLPNGSTALARVAVPKGATKVSAKRKFDFEKIGPSLEGVAQVIRTSLDKAAPDKTTVEFGIEMAAKNKGLSTLVFSGEGKGSLTVTLEWNKKRK